MNTVSPQQSRRVPAFVLAVALAIGGLSATVGAAPASAAEPSPAAASDDFERADGALTTPWTANRGTWSVAGGRATTPSSPGNNVATNHGVELGADYTVTADVDIVASAPAGREWAGVVANVQGTSSLNYYVLRATTAGSGSASWQLLRMTTSTSPTVLTQGTFPAPYGTPLRLSLSRTGTDFDVSIANATTGAMLAEGSHALAVTDPTRIGGWAGLYSNSGNLRARSFSVESSTPAVSPPGALNCKPDGSYDFADADQEVLETVPVGTSFAGVPVTQRVLTDGTDQYVAYYDEDRGMTIAHRDTTSADPAWTTEVLPTTLGWDSHNYISLGLDRDRNLHVAGNMHNVPLIYFRTTTPGDVTTLTRQATMVAVDTENSVTYPEFVNRQDGSLVFSHRNGGSGDGVTYFNVYDEASEAWTRLVDQPLFDGEGSASNPDGTWNAYFENPVLGPDGRFHMIWVWRDTPDAATNSLLTYANSENLVDWFDSAGNPLVSPFRYGEADVVDPVPDGGGLLNGNAKLGFDAAGAPIISYHKYDASGRSQLYVARADGQGDWGIRQISDWDGRWSFGGGGSLVFSVSMRGSQVMPDGNLRVDFTCDNSPQSIVVDGDLNSLAQAPTPPLPPAVTTVRGSYPGLQVNLQTDLAGATDEGTWYLRWESLPSNRDLPRTEWPEEGSPIELVRIGIPAPPADTGALDTAVSESQQLSADAYSARTWAPFADALTAASDLLAAAPAQQEVDAALSALLTARDGLASALTGITASTDTPTIPVGGTVQQSAISVIGTFADGTVSPLPPADWTLGALDSSTPGETTLTVTSVPDVTAPGQAPVTAEIALRVLPEWKSTVAYNDGDRVLYDGSEWKATWWTRAQTPGATSGPWQELRTSPDGQVIWTPTRIFTTGDAVTHDGTRYEARWWTRGQQPGDPNGPWRVLP